MGTMNIFDRVVERDFYLQHMKDTMDWIERKMREAEEAAATDPSLRKRGYDVGIYVEGRWLKQLIAECVAKHQMLGTMQRELLDRAASAIFMPGQPLHATKPDKEPR